MVSRWHQKPFAAQIRHNKSGKEFLKSKPCNPSLTPDYFRHQKEEKSHAERRQEARADSSGYSRWKSHLLKHSVFGDWDGKAGRVHEPRPLILLPLAQLWKAISAEGHPYTRATDNKVEKLRESESVSLAKTQSAKARQVVTYVCGVGGLKPKDLGVCAGSEKKGPAGEESLLPPVAPRGHCLIHSGWWTLWRNVGLVRSSEVLRDAIKASDFQNSTHFTTLCTDRSKQICHLNLACRASCFWILDRSWLLSYLWSSGFQESPHVSAFTFLPKSSYC